MTPSRNRSPQLTPLPVVLDRAGPGWRVVAPSRLHFGLLGFQSSAFPFGGAGVMLDMPAAIVEVVRSDTLRFTGAAASRAEAAAMFWSESTGRALDKLHVHVAHLVGQHVGLGSGTQLAMAVASALFHCHGQADALRSPLDAVEQLAASVHRGGRSSVGSLGFGAGGFIFEHGHLASTPARTIANSHQHLPIPETWRFVICRPTSTAQGIHGPAEQAAFDQLPPVPTTVTSRLMAIVEHEMIPALRAEDLSPFGEAVYEYGKLAGTCFAEVQGGSFASPQVAAIVSELRDFGISGVGQSSWGPAVFATVGDEAAAASLCRWLERRFGQGNLQIEISAASQNGAEVTKISALHKKAI